MLKSKLKSALQSINGKRYAEALEFCENALELDPNNYNALVFQGTSYLNLDKLDNAEVSLRKVVTYSLGQPTAWQGLCNLYEKTGDIQKFIECAQHVAHSFMERYNLYPVLITDY